MDTKSRQKLMRSLLGAILQSNLSDRDLANLAKEIDGHSFGIEFGAMLRRVLPDLAKSSETKKSTATGRVEEAMWHITRRRMSRMGVEELLARASGFPYSGKFNKKETTRETLRHFFETAPPSETEFFLKSLMTGGPDPFLKGISEKGR